jgi:acetyl esterase/lipase
MKVNTLFPILLVLAVAACKSKTNPKVTDSLYNQALAYKIKPTGPPPAWAPDMKPQMQAVIEKLQQYGDQPVETLGAGQARKNHTIERAAADVLKENRISAPHYDVDTMGKNIPAAWGNVHLRFYVPHKISNHSHALLYYHDGGYVTGTLNNSDETCKILATQTGAVVISVGYRLAPQNKFPYAHNDAFRAYTWLMQNAGQCRIDSSKIAVAGEGSGANLAINVALKARDAGLKQPEAILAIYPEAGADLNSASYIKYADALPLTKPMMVWFLKKYLDKPIDIHAPQIDLIAANLKGLAPVILITAEVDPLQTGGLKLVDKLKADGVTVESRNYDGITHGFFGLGAVVPEAKDAEMSAATLLKKYWRH